MIDIRTSIGSVRHACANSKIFAVANINSTDNGDIYSDIVINIFISPYPIPFLRTYPIANRNTSIATLYKMSVGGKKIIYAIPAIEKGYVTAFGIFPLNMSV